MQSIPHKIPVSIIIPNYNYARFLERSIDSALEQDHDDVEVIVVDDASQDNSTTIMESYGDRILVCARRKNGGDEATAQVQSRLHIVDDRQRIKDVFPRPELPFDSGDVMPKLLHKGRYQTTVTSGLAFDRTILESIMPIPETDFRQGADGYLATLAPLYGQVQSIDECVGAYRIHGANHSVFGEKLAERARWRVEHDFHRMEALSDQASQAGLTVVPADVVRHDPVHLEERLASLCADRHRHPVADDSRLALAAAGAVASLEMTASLRRRAVLAAWFLAVGMLPRQMAMAVLSWKLDASSRPAFLAGLSRTIRRAMG
ncbi:MAG: glycosyltransferase [Mesorhizobium sp.]|nr:MAG: glycosyltransferase [Mesorhizobium sp.]